MKAILALEDGRVFNCTSFTGEGEAGAEVVFNTSMSGYQEVLTDPSYSGQMVTMTYPLIGNYGVNTEDVESDRVQVAAFLVREYQAAYSNYRATTSLRAYLEAVNIMGVENLDTRALTRHLRNTGAMRGFISTRILDPDKAVQKARELPGMQGQDLASRVTTETAYQWVDGRPVFFDGKHNLDPSVWTTGGEKFTVVAFDYGIKYNIIRCLENVGCEVVVVPAATSAQAIRAMAPDGVFLSNGPGDPEPVVYAVETIKDLLGEFPMFGICLGHQILGLALGGKSYKLKFGHRGINQPVKNLDTGKIEITSQNHGFVVDLDSLKHQAVEITHVNLNDGTLEGFRHTDYPLFAVQYHPEASPGPHDASYLFKNFTTLMTDHKNHA
ncbi:MAG: glutamine-hydrolyzing carbamoyl-phosphate synthase small subunit [Desulfobacterales bacterium]|nr:glutamine-hydrolyzing carbamoyl-phosphate synthase small subunit [Desulfobacterales bacterium]